MTNIIQSKTAFVAPVNDIDSELVISCSANHHPLDTSTIGETK